MAWISSFKSLPQNYAQTGGGGYAFDYYISPTGDDNNVGSLASPWSITALNNNQATYAGKKIGIIGDVGGTQTPIQYGTVGGVQTTLYSIYESLPAAPATAGSQVLVVNGGTSGASPTILASCNSAGVYTPRWAIIDASQPGTGNKPDVAGALIAQNNYRGYGVVSNWGNVTFDGLTVRYFTSEAIQVFPPYGDYTGVIIKNCEIYGGGNVISNNNPGAVWIQNCYQAQIINNKIHDCHTVSMDAYGTLGSEYPGGHTAIFSFTSASNNGMIVKYNTAYNVGAGVYMKDYLQYAEIAYNYLDISGCIDGNSANIMNFGVAFACPPAGQTLYVHHNIFVGCGVYDFPASASNHTSVMGLCQIQNNTIYAPSTQITKLMAWTMMTATYTTVWGPPSDGGTGTFQNNIVWSDGPIYTGDPGTLDIAGLYGITGTSVNYNAYGSPMAFGTYHISPPGLAADSSLATWQAAGFDLSTTIMGSSPFNATPTLLSPTTFSIKTGAGTAYTAGVGGAIAGACDHYGNAADGSGRIGCNF